MAMTAKTMMANSQMIGFLSFGTKIARAARPPVTKESVSTSMALTVIATSTVRSTVWK